MAYRTTTPTTEDRLESSNTKDTLLSGKSTLPDNTTIYVKTIDELKNAITISTDPQRLVPIRAILRDDIYIDGLIDIPPETIGITIDGGNGKSLVATLPLDSVFNVRTLKPFILQNLKIRSDVGCGNVSAINAVLATENTTSEAQRIIFDNLDIEEVGSLFKEDSKIYEGIFNNLRFKISIDNLILTSGSNTNLIGNADVRDSVFTNIRGMAKIVPTSGSFGTQSKSKNNTFTNLKLIGNIQTNLMAQTTLINVVTIDPSIITVSPVDAVIGTRTVNNDRTTVATSTTALNSTVQIAEVTAPTTPDSGFGYLYEKSIDKKIYFKNSDGVEYDLGASGSAGSGSGGTGSVLGTGVENRVALWRAGNELTSNPSYTFDGAIQRITGSFHVLKSANEALICEIRNGTSNTGVREMLHIGQSAHGDGNGLSLIYNNYLYGGGGGYDAQRNALIWADTLGDLVLTTRFGGNIVDVVGYLGTLANERYRATSTGIILNHYKTANVGLQVKGTTNDHVISVTGSGDMIGIRIQPNDDIHLSGNIKAQGYVRLSGSVGLTQFAELGSIATPATPIVGYGKIYGKIDKKLYFLDSDGLETDLLAGGSGLSSSNAVNRGSGEGLFKGKSDAGTIQLRSFVAGTGITIASGSEEITINNSITQGITASNGVNYGAGQFIFKGKSDAGTLQFRSLIAGTGMNFGSGSDAITIDSTISQGLTASNGVNVGSGHGLVKGKSDSATVQFRTILAGTNVTIDSGSSDITINADNGAGSTGSVKGTGVDNRIAVWSAGNQIDSDANLDWDGTRFTTTLGSFTSLTSSIGQFIYVTGSSLLLDTPGDSPRIKIRSRANTTPIMLKFANINNIDNLYLGVDGVSNAGIVSAHRDLVLVSEIENGGLGDIVFGDSNAATPTEHFRIKNGTQEAVFNDPKLAYNFRISGQTNQALIVVSASTNNVGLRTHPVDDIHLSGNVKFQGRQRISGAVGITSTLTVESLFTALGASVLAGHVTADTTFAVTNTSVFNNNVSISGSLGIADNLDIDGRLDVKFRSLLTNTDVTGTVGVKGSVLVSGSISYIPTNIRDLTGSNPGILVDASYIKFKSDAASGNIRLTAPDYDGQIVQLVRLDNEKGAGAANFASSSNIAIFDGLAANGRFSSWTFMSHNNIWINTAFINNEV